MGGSGPVVWSYFAEFQPKSKRGSMLSFMAAFWTLGNLFVAGLAWLIIPEDIGLYFQGFVYNSWRIFLVMCSLPSFIVACLLFYLPESPKFLLTRGRPEKAIEIFKNIYHINTGNDKELYPVKHLILDDIESDARTKEPVKGKFKNMMTDIRDHSRELFMNPIAKFTVISITINLTFHIGYYGLMMWFPELFNRFGEYARVHPDKSASVCQVTDFIVQNGSQQFKGNDHCSSRIESNVFTESLITVASAIPANIAAILFIDKLGRKFFLGELTLCVLWFFKKNIVFAKHAKQYVESH